MVKWISVKDRYPEKSDLKPREMRPGYVVYEHVFLCYSTYGSLSMSTFVMPPKEDGTYYRGYFQGWQNDDVTHWAKINLPTEE